MSAPPPPPKGGMSLYANLLNPKPDSSASISSAPVLYDNNDKDDAAKKDVNSGRLQLLPSFMLLSAPSCGETLRADTLTCPILSALRFQPIRRPQVTQKKPAKPTSFPKSIPAGQSSTTNDATAAAATAAAVAPPTTATGTPPPQQRSTLADWAATHDEDEFLYAAQEKRQRGGRKAAKKRKRQTEQRETDWDEIYDPARPTNVDEYLRSEERVREVQEWKAVLYAHRKRRGTSEDGDSEDSEGERITGGGSKSSCSDRPTSSSTLLISPSACSTDKFAPPASYSFAPPPASPPRDSSAAAIAPVPVPDDATGDDAYARRLALSGMGAPPPPPPSHIPTPPPPPPPPQEGSTTISRAPVRYEAPPQPPPPPPPTDEMDIDHDDDDDDDAYDPSLPPSLGLGASTATAPEDEKRRTNLPGQKGFAQRLMSKYGWTAGSGLGAESSGIVNPLSVKVEKRRKKPDAEGGGFAEPGGRGKIIGGRTAASSNAASDAGKFGPMSEVIVLRNMLEGMDNLQDEINDGLGQEIGEECGDKYGRVERLYIDVDGRQVFIKFTDAVSALRAVNALEGRVFNGNAIAARFWDGERFERGEYN